MQILERVAELKVIPVIKLDRVEDAAPLAEALTRGGLPAAEITFRTDAAAGSIAEISKKFPDMLVGAGTLTTVDQAKQALDAGASFFVTAGFNRKVTEFAVEHQIPILPGVCTPTELMFLLEYNLPVAKFFPASQYGGLDTIKALAAPFPQMKFMPTGGINAGNILEYLAFPKVIACGGSWMVKADWIRDGQFDTIAQKTAEAVTLVKGA